RADPPRGRRLEARSDPARHHDAADQRLRGVQAAEGRPRHPRRRRAHGHRPGPAQRQGQGRRRRLRRLHEQADQQDGAVAPRPRPAQAPRAAARVGPGPGLHRGGGAPPAMTARVLLHPRRARPFYGRHPWVFAGAVAGVEGDPADGDEVDLVAHGGDFVARGLYNSQSEIRVRLYRWEPEAPLDAAFFRDRLAAAVRLRDRLGLNAPGRGCRLVFSEGDGLSGCTVDRFDRWLVVQFTSLALARRREMLAGLLAELVRPEGIYLRTERGVG